MSHRSPRERAWVWIAIAVVAALGWLLRAWPALSSGSWRGDTLGYDAAIYYSGSALLWRGEVPYRDFLLAHPPGILVLLAPITSLVSILGPAEAVPFARWLMTLVGVANIVLSARLALRVAGPVAAIAAALAYALWPQAVSSERSTFLEPFLNLTCLLGASVWLSDDDGRARNRALIAGLWLGLACALKLWGVLWVVACMLAPVTAVATTKSDPAPIARALRGSAESWKWLSIGAAIAVLAVAGPFALVAPGAFFEQTIRFQLERPLDGVDGGLERLRLMVNPAWPFLTLAAIGLSSALTSPSALQRRLGCVFGAALVSTLAAFVVAASYFPNYNAFLAPAEAPLVGLGAASLWGQASRVRFALVARVAVVSILLLSAWVPFARALPRGRPADERLVLIGERVRSFPAEACYIAFEPDWALAGDRLPTIREGRDTLLDIYGVMLIAAPSSERGRVDARSALQSAAAQQRVREVIAGCEYLSLGDRVRQLTPSTARWILERWERLPADPTGADFWRLRR